MESYIVERIGQLKFKRDIALNDGNITKFNFISGQVDILKEILIKLKPSSDR